MILCCGGDFATTSTARSKRDHASECSSDFFGNLAMSQEVVATLIAIFNKLPRRALTELGRIAAAWAYLETEFDLALECLLVDPRCKELHDDYIILPFKTRLALMRSAASRI